MERCCSVCGQRFEAKRSTARYCSSSCRGQAAMRRARGAPESDADVIKLPGAVGPPSQDDLVSVVTAQLEAAGKLNTYAAQQALVLANRLRLPGLDTGSALASLSKELDRLMTGLLADVKQERDELDEIQGRVVEMRSRRRRA